MSKTKKHKTPNINPSVLARPRLDALFEKFAQGEPDLDGMETGVRALTQELGSGPILDAVEAAPLMERAFAARKVDKMVVGEWEDVQIELGLKPARTQPKRGGLFDLFEREP